MIASLRWQILSSLHHSQPVSRLPMVQRLCVTLRLEVYNLAAAQAIIESFCQSFRRLNELVMVLPWLGPGATDLFTLSDLLSSRGVASFISNGGGYLTMYSSPTPVTAGHFDRSFQVLHPNGAHRGTYFFIHKSLNHDLPNIIQLAGVNRVSVTRFTAYAEVEDSLKKLEHFSVVREAGDEREVVEEEVEAATQLLDLLADTERRGRLGNVNLDKVDFTQLTSQSQTKPFS